MKKFLAAALVAVSLVALFFCTTAAPAGAFNFAPEDLSQNREHKIPVRSAKPQRIVSMSPAITEILFALGAGDRVVGVTSYSDYPSAAKSIPSIGGYQAPDLETVVALAPDIVFAMGEIQSKPIHILEQAQIPVISIEPATLEEVIAAIDLISEVIGEQEQGRLLHDELTATLHKVKQRLAQAPRKSVFVEVWDAPLLTVGSKSFVNDIITQAGGVNVAAGNPVDYTPCDIETLYAANPDSYLVISHSRQDIRNFADKPELADMAAVKNQQVFQLEDDLLVRPGPRCFAGLVAVATVLHPDLMQGWEK
jgi:iron complex transport system substrate-binding protein